MNSTASDRKLGGWGKELVPVNVYLFFDHRDAFNATPKNRLSEEGKYQEIVDLLDKYHSLPMKSNTPALQQEVSLICI